MATLKEGSGAWWIGAVLLLLGGGTAQAHHWDWAYAESGHAMPVVDFAGPNASSCETDCPLADANSLDPEKQAAFFQCTRDHQCQPLIATPPSPDRSACLAGDEITSEAQFYGDTGQCLPNFTQKMAAITDPGARHSKASCCLQYEIGARQDTAGKQPWRGYQLTFGPYDMNAEVNDEFTIGYSRMPNGDNLDRDGQTYEYMVAFEFWQYSGSHHFIMDDLLGPYNDPDHARDCGGDSQCQKFASLAETCPAATRYDSSGQPVSSPRTNPQSPGACDAPSGMRGFPTAGSPGPSYFPVPYPDGVGIKISRNHIFRMTHHLQHWFDPQRAQVWINIYTVPAKRIDGSENVKKEAHVFFDGSASPFLIPPHSIARAQGAWVAPRNIELYGLTFHSHKRNILAHADLVGPDGNPKALPARTYQYSRPVCGGFQGCRNNDLMTCDQSRPPMHLYESTHWYDHEQCPYWREETKDGESDNDSEGAIIIKQGEGIRYECLVNNGVLPFQALVGAGVMSAAQAEYQSQLPPYALAAQAVPLQPRDAFGRVVRGKFSCEEIPGVIPGFPGAGALGYYGNRPCLPDVLKGKDPSTDLLTSEGGQAVASGAAAAECNPSETWTQFKQNQFPFKGNYTGKCVPASIGFAETEDDEMCILLGLYAFTDDDTVPSPVDRLPTDVGR